MVILNADHPEILDFIDWKLKEEDKVFFLKLGSEQLIKLYEEYTKIPLSDKQALNNFYETLLKQGYPENIIKRFDYLLSNRNLY